MKGYYLDHGGKHKDESLYVSPSSATYFNQPYPTLPTQVKVKRLKGEGWKGEGWKGEKVKRYRRHTKDQ